MTGQLHVTGPLSLIVRLMPKNPQMRQMIRWKRETFVSVNVQWAVCTSGAGVDFTPMILSGIPAS